MKNKLVFLIPLLLIPALSTTGANAASCDSGNFGKFYCLGYSHGVAQKDSDAAAGILKSPDCPNSDPSNPKNGQYCAGFVQGYNDEANRLER